MTRTENTKRNLIWGTATKIISLLFPFLTRTVLIRTLGMEYVGLSSLFTSLLGILNLTELGVGSAIVFSMYEPIAAGNDEKVCALLAFYRKCYRWIALAVLCMGILMELLLPVLIDGDIPADVEIHILFLVYLTNTVVSYLTFAYKTSVFQASQRVDFVNKINMATNVLLNVVQMVLLLCFRNYYLYILAMPIVTLINNILTEFFSRKEFPQYYCGGMPSENELAIIKKNVSGMVFQKIGSVVLFSVDTIVISAFLGLTTVGIYNNYYMILNAVAGFIGIIQSSMIPSLGNSIAQESVEKNYGNMKQILFLYAWIMEWASTCFFCLLQPFMEWWQGDEYMLPLSIAACFTLYLFVHHIGDISYCFKEASGLWWEGKWVPMISSAVNLVLNIVLVQVIGLYGILLSTVVAIAFINIPFGGKVLFQYYFKDLRKWHQYLKSLLWYGAVAAVSCAVTYAVCNLVQVKSLILLIFLRAIICVIIPNLVLLLFHFRNPNFRPAVLFMKKAMKLSGKRKQNEE